MPSKNIFKFLILFVGIFLIGSVYIFSSDDDGAIRILTGTGGKFMNTGSIETVYGNFGEISFDEEPKDVNKAHMSGASLIGYFWTQSSGWMIFTGASIYPKNTGSGIREEWTATGWIWSDHAGYSALTDVSYFPESATLTGWVWSDTLGWLGIDSIVGNVGLGFIGRVKILGNIGSKSVYQTNFDGYDQQGVYAYGTVADAINAVKKNIALRLRNAGDSINSDFALEPESIDGMIYYVADAPDKYLSYSEIEEKFKGDNVRTIVVVGADIYINTGVVLDPDASPHALVALKNENQLGGNIYINGGVTKVQSTLMAEGSIYSARRLGNWDFYNYNRVRALTLPNNQLYIKGSVISRNTIGGAGVLGGSKCPFTETNCSYDQALRYDFNYFRDFQTGALSSTGIFIPDPDVGNRRGYPDATYDDKSLIIEYDPRIVSDPPPGF